MYTYKPYITLDNNCTTHIQPRYSQHRPREGIPKPTSFESLWPLGPIIQGILCLDDIDLGGSGLYGVLASPLSNHQIHDGLQQWILQKIIHKSPHVNPEPNHNCNPFEAPGLYRV